MDAKKFIGAVLLLFCVTACLAKQPKYRDCGSVKGKVLTVNISSECNPDECILKKGENVNFEVKFVPNEIVTASKAFVKGDIAGVKVPFPIPNSDGCYKSGLTCPMKAGQTVQYSSTIFVKKIFPSVKVVVEWSLEDQTKNVIWCVAIPVKLV